MARAVLCAGPRPGSHTSLWIADLQTKGRAMPRAAAGSRTTQVLGATCHSRLVSSVLLVNSPRSSALLWVRLRGCCACIAEWVPFLVLQSEEATTAHGLGGMPNLSVMDPVDCGYPYINPDHCRKRGCVWEPSADRRQPFCRHPKPAA